VRTRNAGYSLIELLTVVAIMGLVSVYVGRILTVNEQAYQITDQTSEAQQNLRAIENLLERDLRHAGFMVPDPIGICGVDDRDGPDTLYVSDALAIDQQDDFTSYSGASATLSSGGVGTAGGSAILALSSLIIEPSPPSRPAYDTDGDGANDSDFQVGGGVIFSDAASETSLKAGVGCGTVTNVDIGNKRITVTVRSPLSSTGSLIAAPAHEYRISGTQLLWNGSVIADGIDDFQVTYIVDNDDDGVFDADEDFGDNGTADHNLFNSATPNHGTGTITLTDSASSLVREVRVNVIARTRIEDESFTMGHAQAKENRDVSSATADGFRRRTVTTTVMLRNIGVEV